MGVVRRGHPPDELSDDLLASKRRRSAGDHSTPTPTTLPITGKPRESLILDESAQKSSSGENFAAPKVLKTVRRILGQGHSKHRSIFRERSAPVVKHRRKSPRGRGFRRRGAVRAGGVGRKSRRGGRHGTHPGRRRRSRGTEICGIDADAGDWTILLPGAERLGHG